MAISDISETVGGGLSKFGFSSIEEAGLWGWENAKQLRITQGVKKYGGIVYFYHNPYPSPPNFGSTNYWWGYYWHDGSGPHHYFPIVYDPESPVEPSPLKQPRTCETSTPVPKAGNPIIVSTGNKYQAEIDYKSNAPFGLKFVRYYNSSSYDVGTTIGIKWQHNYSRHISVAGNNALTYRGNGQAFVFNFDGANWHGDVDIADTLVEISDGDGERTGWLYTTSSDTVEQYNAKGILTKITNRQGQTQVLDFELPSNQGGDDNDYTLDRVTGFSGEQLHFKSDVSERIISITDPMGNSYSYNYDDIGNLSSVVYPDNTPDDASDNPIRFYHYENTSFPHALTGITDENGNRYATWTYDAQGRAKSSEHTGGVDKTTLAYNTDGTTTVTNPLGKQTTYHFTTINGVRKVTQVEGHPTTSCEGANKAYSYDTNGNVISKTDWNGVTTTYTYDLSRNLELSRTEAVGTPQERTITTQWHPGYRLPIKITEPDRITEYIYDAQGQQLSYKVRDVQ